MTVNLLPWSFVVTVVGLALMILAMVVDASSGVSERRGTMAGDDLAQIGLAYALLGVVSMVVSAIFV